MTCVLAISSEIQCSRLTSFVRSTRMLPSKSESFEKLSCKVPRQSFGAKSIGLGTLTRCAFMSLSNIVFGVSTRVIPYNTQPSVADTSTLLLHGHVCICVMS